jgi:hypothetical protein
VPNSRNIVANLLSQQQQPTLLIGTSSPFNQGYFNGKVHDFPFAYSPSLVPHASSETGSLQMHKQHKPDGITTAAAALENCPQRCTC